MKKIKAVVAGTLDPRELYESTAEKKDEEKDEETTQVYDAGEMVHKTTKLFWRTNTTLEIRLYFQKSLDIVSIQVFNQSEDKEMPVLYARKSDIESFVDAEALEEQVKVAIQTSDVRKEGQSDAIREKTEWEFYSQYILARLKIPDSSNPFPTEEMEEKLGRPITPETRAIMPFLSKLSDDKYDSLMVSPPANIEPPPEIPKEVSISVEDFNKAFSSFQEGAGELKKMRTSAEKMSKIIAISINAFGNAETDRLRRKSMSVEQARWSTLFTLWIVRKQVEEVRKRLETSPAYQDLVAETEEKRLAAEREESKN